ncbi:hypothetical protein M3Y98_00457000 [Aphelenchoides besseyi]|nr:hypothetical protein M3Y98_00457000 [Aphelenchoides besseyi]KAI6207447.1 hypothetical protein M3Y96_00009900 [Aphelenchoides besseyi]
MNSTTKSNEEKPEVYVYEERNLYPVHFKPSSSAIPGEVDETTEGARLAVAQPSQYHFDGLRNFPAFAHDEDHNLFDHSVPSTHVQNASESGIMTRQLLLKRVQQLKSGQYRAVVVDGQLHFMVANDEKTATARSTSPAQTARSLTNTDDCATAHSIGKSRQLAAEQVESGTKITVDHVVKFLNLPGASEALAEYKKNIESKDNRAAAGTGLGAET